MRAFWIAAGLLGLSACATSSAQPADQTLAAVLAAKPHACPAASMQANARTSGETVRSGVTETELARTKLANDSVGRVLRMRRLVVAPGGVLPWHDHAARQGMDLIVSGEMVEYRNDCREPLTHKPGDLIDEGPGVAHWWRNESKADAVLLVFDAPPPG